MDRRVFMALGILAAAAGSPVFAEQVRVASDKGELLHVNRGALIQAIYRVAMSGKASTVGGNALMKLGHNKGEAAQITALTISIARKSRSAANFEMLVDGREVAGVMLDDRERALLSRYSGGNAAGGSVWDGRTWEGSAYAATRLHTKWDGYTWEGSAR